MNKLRGTILIVGDTIDGQLSPGARQLGSKAWSLADRLDCDAVGILCGHDLQTAAHDWSESTGLSVIALENAQCRYPHPDLLAAMAAPLISEFSARAVCFPHAMRTCQAAAALAWQLQVPCVTAVESITFKENELIVKRSQYEGRLIASQTVDRFPVVLTLIPGGIPGEPRTDKSKRSPTVEIRRPDMKDDRFTPLAVDRLAGRDQGLENALVIVSGGRGLGAAENKKQLEETAALFKNSAVGASRGACDLGWLPHGLQIGETGRTVAPALYLACGISGAPQHLAGMRESRTIVAINTDKRAAIGSVAHYFVREDLNTFLPLLRERHEKTDSPKEK